MEPSSEVIASRVRRLALLLSGSGAAGASTAKNASSLRKALHREGLLDAFCVLYEESCNEAKHKADKHIKAFIEKYRGVIMELKQIRVNPADFEIKNVIGRGHFGEVHVVKEKQTDDVYAMKTLRKEATLRQSSSASYEDERNIMASVKSEWLVKLQYAFQDATHLYLVMEFCPGGDLAGLLERRGQPFLEEEATFYLAETVQGINTVHSMGYVHRDIKPDNIYLDRCGHLKLGDFGSAAKVSIKGTVNTPVAVGTPNYIAPELLKALEDPKHSHGIQCDYWSLGVLAYELVTRKTPFASLQDNSSAQVYSSILQHCRSVGGAPLRYPIQNQTISAPSEHYKDLIKKLLHPQPDKRLTYDDLLKHKLFKSITWSSLRKKAPPFVPSISRSDDTSNFSPSQRQPPGPSLDNIRSKNSFSGRNLPFVGFTYVPDCGSSNVSSDNLESGSNSSGEQFVFANGSFNGTAICLTSSREMEKLLDSRKKEIETLQKDLAKSELKAMLANDVEKRMSKLEKQRSTLEQELTEMACQKQKLQVQLEKEHDDRSMMETKALKAVRSARKKWQSELEEKEKTLRTTIDSQESQLKQINFANNTLTTRLDQAAAALEKANLEIENLKEAQKSHKDSMAKARRLSRQSIILGTEQVSSQIQEAQQIQSLKSSLNRELQVKEKIENDLKAAKELEKNLRRELEESKKSQESLKVTSTNTDSLKLKIKELETENKFLLSRGTQRLGEERDKGINLQNALDKERKEVFRLKNKIQDMEFSICSLESDCADKDGLISQLKKQQIVDKTRTENAIAQEEKHRKKVATLEDLMNKLQNEVNRLEKQQSKKHKDEKKEYKRRSEVGAENGGAGGERATVLQEQIERLEEQLCKTREEATLQKQEARKANSALWKKEKELSDAELDKRIASRELKQIEEKLKILEEEKKSETEKHEKTLGELRVLLRERNEEIKKLNKEVETLNASIEKCEKSLEEYRSSVDEDATKHAKTSAELDRCKNDVYKLKAELQYSENRRLKSEAMVDRSLTEAKRSEADRCAEREEKVRLEVELNERNRECEGLQMNYKILQEACTILEDQLNDFEKLTETQDDTNNKLKDEIINLHQEIEKLRLELGSKEDDIKSEQSEVAVVEQRYNELLRDSEEERARNDELERYVDELLTRETNLNKEVSERGEKISILESDLKKSSTELVRYQQELIDLKEECSHLLSEMGKMREDNMNSQYELREAQKNIEILRSLTEERDEELESQRAHWHQRELKAEATIAQQIKLIDFLQSKVEDLSKKKKTIGDMLFGSKNKENSAPLSTPQTPLRNTPSIGIGDQKTLLRERSKNRELMEQVAALQYKLEEIHGSVTKKKSDVALGELVQNTPKRINSGKIVKEKLNLSNDQITMEGWVRIQKDKLLDRVYMKLVGHRLEWRASNQVGSSKTSGELLLAGKARLVKTVSKSDTSIILSETEINQGFKIENIYSTGWPQSSLLVVCPSQSQKSDWLIEIGKVITPEEDRDTLDGESITSASALNKKDFLLTMKHDNPPNCISEVEEGLLLLGTDKNLYSWFKDKRRSLVSVTGIQGVTKVRLAAAADVAVLLDEAGRLWHCTMRHLVAALNADATAQPIVTCEEIHLRKSSSDDSATCVGFELSSVKQSTDRLVLCASSNSQLFIFGYNCTNLRFSLFKFYNIEFFKCMRITQHSVIFCSDRIFEIDLKNYRCEEFLDASDVSLSHVAYAYKKKLYPMAVVQTKKTEVDKSNEYLICFNEFGVFVDEYGQRSRPDDVKWPHCPINFLYRKPFLFIQHHSCVSIMHVDSKNPEKDDVSLSTMSTSTVLTVVYETVSVEVENPRLLGKSMTPSSVYISERKQLGDAKVYEICGNNVFKKDIGLSIETLDAIDDVDSCKNLKTNISIEETSNDDSVEVKSDFAMNIRQKAKLLATMKEKQKVDEIQSILSGSDKLFTTPTSRHRATSARSATKGTPKSVIRPSSFDSTSISSDSSSSSSRKQVRFERN